MPQLPIQMSSDIHEPMDLDFQDTFDQSPIIIDEVNLDLENHISHYHGLPKILRLEFIADHCKSLRVEALQLALDYIKEYTYNVKDYIRLFKKLQEAMEERGQNIFGMMIDKDWIDSRNKQANLRLERLDSELKNYRHNQMKENIRRGQDDLGDHYLDCGDIENAFNAYAKSREYALTQRSQVSQCLNMIRVSLLLKHWSVVANNVTKAELQPTVDTNNTTTTTHQNHNNQSIPTKLHCASGLFELYSRRYKKAAKHFLSTNFDHFNGSNGSSLISVSSSNSLSNTSGTPSSAPNHRSSAPGVSSSSSSGNNQNIIPSSSSSAGGGGSGERDLNSLASNHHNLIGNQWDILAPVNIAVYGSLCALATYNRQELADHLINSASFKQFSELDPQLRDAVSKFYESKYAACLAILQEMKNILLLDMYLAPHVERLYRMIMNKSLVQYFEPYSTASLHKMALAFDKSVPELEREIITLICDGHIKARIDSHNKILYSKNTDPRTMTFEKAIKMGERWQRQTRALITRTVILNRIAGIVQQPK